VRFFFSTVGRHNPTRRTPMPEHMTYPVSQHAERGLDLDYTALLVGRGFIIDGEVFQDLVESDRPYLRPMVRSLARLADAGLLEPVDMGAIIEANSEAILQKTDMLLEQPGDWLADMQRQWNLLRPEFARFQQEYGTRSMQDLNLGHVGVESWLDEIGRPDDGELRERLMAVMAGDVGATELVAPRDVKGIMRFVLAEILCTDLIHHQLQQPFIDWDDARPFFDRLYTTRWDDIATEYEIRRQARILFDVVIPELRPDNVEKVIQFVKDDKAVASLRDEIIHTLTAGEEVSYEWLSRYLNAAVRKDLVTEGRVRKVRWLGSAAGAIIPGGSLVQGLATEAGVSAIEAAAEGALEGRERGPRWYYALQRIGIKAPPSSGRE
jgi:hypothetical protein